MKGQFFIISSVIMIYVIVLSFQYLTSFSDIRVSQIEEQQELSYIQKIKDDILQTYNISNSTNNGNLNMVSKDVRFTKNFLNQELLKRGIDFDSKFIFFSNNFETGFSKWTNVNGSPEITNQNSYGGQYSLYSYGLENVSKKLDGMNEVYARIYVNFKTLPTNGYRHYFIGFYDHGSQILGLGIWNDLGTYKLRAYSYIGAGSYWASSINIDENEWHYFELYWYENDTNSNIKAWYDGNLKIENNTFDSQSEGKAIDEYKVGAVEVAGVSTTPDFYVDCVAISSDYIGGNCYPDEEPYFVFNMRTKEMNTNTEFSYEEETVIPSTPLSGTVLWFKFNEGVGIRAFDSSDYHFDGTYYGESFNDGTFSSYPARVNGFFGNGLKFDGYNDYINCGNDDSLTINGSFSISAWVYITGPHNYSTVLRKSVSIGNDTNYVLDINSNNRIRFFIYDTNGVLQGIMPSTNSITPNAWVYVVGTYDGSTFRIYINGTLDPTTDTWSGSMKSTTGNMRIGSGPSGNYFNGTMDEVRLWNKALTLAEINAERNSYISIIRPLASYSFEEPSGATYVNDTHIWVNGTYGPALSFNGVNNYVYVNDNEYLDNMPQITIMAWFELNQLSSSKQDNEAIVTKKDSASPWNSYKLYQYKTNNRLYFLVRNSTQDYVYADAGVIQANQWYHVAGVYNGTNVLIYLDGVLKDWPTFYGNIFNSDYPLRIGADWTGAERLNGTVDSVKIWNRALSSDEIILEMNKE